MTRLERSCTTICSCAVQYITVQLVKYLPVFLFSNVLSLIDHLVSCHPWVPTTTQQRIGQQQAECSAREQALVPPN